MFQDAFNITNSADKLRVFNANWNWQVWHKPRWVQIVSFLLIWSGASWAWAWQNSWWGGGGSSSVTRWWCLASQIPDVLYVFVGAWPAWTAWTWTSSTAAWTVGNRSFVSVQPENSAFNLLLASWDTAAQASAATGGNSVWWAAGTAMTAASAVYSCLLSRSSVAWQAGWWSSYGTVWDSITALSWGVITTWWPWGGWLNFAWGGIIGQWNAPSISWWPANTIGMAWYNQNNLMFFLSGTWGGGSGTNTPWAWSDSSWYGCGWPWGGSATTGVGGKWWKWGDGIVVIMCR